MYNPRSTYRIQFNKDFTFSQFLECIDYFALLGTGTIYASPVFAATPGSMHGYDVTDPLRFNSETGSESEFDEIIGSLKKKDIGWLQDIVPNHMAFHSDNRWLADVLEHGRQSEYAQYFDIDFDHPGFGGKVILPFLGKNTDEAIDSGEIRLVYRSGRFLFEYFDSYFPVNKESIVAMLEKDDSEWFHKIAENVRKNAIDADQLWVLEDINSDKLKIRKLLSYQHYVLAFWKEADVHLNYRRFFTISSLISLQMDNEVVFNNYHSFISKLIADKKIQGLRVDHIDGLRNPPEYIEKLRLMCGDETYIVAEKILERNEELPSSWPLQGTSGYDFMAILNNLLTHSENYPALRAFYTELTGITDDPENIVYQKKKLILSQGMQADLDNLCRMFIASGFVPEDDGDITPKSVREAIGEFLLACRRYKLYSDSFPLNDEDASLVESMISLAVERNPSLAKPLAILRDVILGNSPLTEENKEKALNFFLRCMQFTGPLMAKGQEDTAMYWYNCFIGHNEVGDSIGASGINVEEFHEVMLQRLRKMPLSMSATSTHDTKRGEDARARLAVISELPELWIKNVNHWVNVNKQFKSSLNGRDVPDSNEEYFIYQTLIGVFQGPASDSILPRINEYLVKALREAKTNSSWDKPDADYEKAVLEFVGKILSPGSVFQNFFLPFQQKIATYGITNSLAQVIIKSTCPGIPDFYQGTELWDLSLVDPDNRRPVDYVLLEKTLKTLIDREQQSNGNFLTELFAEKENGNIKMWFTHILLKERRLNGGLFVYGEYIPLTVTGRYREHILAYSRSYLGVWYIVIVPLYTAIVAERQDNENISWDDTIVELPDLAPDQWISLADNSQISTDGYIEVSEVLKIPVPYVLKGNTGDSPRKAGILLHITSLPGSYGTGDIGPEAYKFLDFLSRAGQTYWQILPVNPVSRESNYSPYSTYSAFAGNLLLTDPEWLVKQNLISGGDICQFVISDQAEFEKAEEFRMKLLEKAYLNFKKHPRPLLLSKFKEFCDKQKYWIDDYVLYYSLRKAFRKPWYAWPGRLRDRNAEELGIYFKKFEEESEKLKFFQFIFSEQWEALKDYAGRKNIRIIGDMSIYVSYDSADVWQHPEVFKLDVRKRMVASGGAPPDYFSKTGQLWNMPVYNWEKLKKTGFEWWINRLSRNLEWFDLLRLDHFRGFSAFWEVPAGDPDAVNGSWKQAPGKDFFLKVKKNFPEMPFIAEDLGEIDEKVYELRDSFGLRGMKVLQFAFDDAHGKSIHLPHNYIKNSIVYTGTHDNNTTRGWYEQEIPVKFKIWVDEYIGKKLIGSGITEEFIRLAYASVSQIAIVPIQDLLGLGPGERFNNPAGDENNWKWKMKTMDRFHDKSRFLRKLVKLYWRV